MEGTGGAKGPTSGDSDPKETLRPIQTTVGVRRHECPAFLPWVRGLKRSVSGGTAKV